MGDEKMKEKILTLKAWIDEASTITFFTGAGMSTESGIPDFRSTGGFYDGDENREYYISNYYYQKHPKDFWKRYKEIFELKLMGGYLPNSGHSFIKDLEDFGKKVFVLTQNVDGLHTKAGSFDVTELHGTIQSATCPKCKTSFDLEFINQHDIPRCPNDQFILKPDVVLFGDEVKSFDSALNKAYAADLFIVMGTSLEVYPVNQIPLYISRSEGIKRVIINKESTKMDDKFHLVFHEKIGDVIKEIKIGS
jgi:NAD-dependent deacetylase